MLRVAQWAWASGGSAAGQNPERRLYVVTIARKTLTTMTCCERNMVCELLADIRE